jgi:hypothetical protein
VTLANSVGNPSHSTPPSSWLCMGVMPARAKRGYFWYAFPGAYRNVSSVILEPTDTDAGDGGFQAFDEMKLYAVVSVCVCVCTYYIYIYIYIYIHIHM